MLETLDPGFLLTPAGRLAAVAVAAALAAAALLALGPRRRAAPAGIATGLRLPLHTADLGLDRSPGAAHAGVWRGRPLAPPLRHHRKLVAVGGRPGQAQARGVVTAFATPAPAPVSGGRDVSTSLPDVVTESVAKAAIWPFESDTPQTVEAPARVVCICGPSGVGKSTLLKELVRRQPGQYSFCVSHTSRPRRANEVDGIDYHFVTPGQARHMIQTDAFVEWANVHGHVYGTSFQALADVGGQPDRVCLVDVNSDGVRSMLGEPGLAPLVVLLEPPSAEHLEQRLLARKSESPDSAARRLAAAAAETAALRPLADRAIVNDNIAAAAAELHSAVSAHFANAASAPARRKFGAPAPNRARTARTARSLPPRGVAGRLPTEASRLASLPSSRPSGRRNPGRADTKMSLFGMSPAELLVIGAVAVFVLGPDKLSSVAKDLGKVAGELKEVPKEFQEGLGEVATAAPPPPPAGPPPTLPQTAEDDVISVDAETVSAETVSAETVSADS